MFKSSENLRLAAEMRALQRVAAPWREARTTWFDGTPESIEARLAQTDRVLTHARSGFTTAHLALTREAEAARRELVEARHRLMVDFLDDSARAFKGSRRVAEDLPAIDTSIDESLVDPSWDHVGDLTNFDGGGKSGLKGPQHTGGRRLAGERGLRECINCGGGLSGEEDDDKESECPNCGMSAHHKGVDWRKEGSHRTAVDTHGYNWPDDFPLPEGTSPIDNGDGTMTCPNCGYDEVKANTSSTCPECDHYDDNFLDDSDEAVGGFERAMERKYPILPEHGGPESGLWGGKHRRPFESARLAAGRPGVVPSHGFPITEGDHVHWIGSGGHPDKVHGRVLEYPAMGPDINEDGIEEDPDAQIPYHDLALVDWGPEVGEDLAGIDEIVPNQHLNEFKRKLRRRSHRTAANHIGMDWRYVGSGEDDGESGHDAYTEVGDMLQTHAEHPSEPIPGRPGHSRVRTDLPPIGWGYGIWTYEPPEDGDYFGSDHWKNGGDRDGDYIWAANNGKKLYPTHDEAKAAAEAHYYLMDHAGRSRVQYRDHGGGHDSGVDYDAIINNREPLDDDFGDIFGKESSLRGGLNG